MTFLPRIIQGGMGVAVSNWRLANAVSRTGQLGVVSGTVLDTVMVRRLQDGRAVPPELHLRIDVTLAPREVLLVTYDAEGRQLVAVRYPKRPAAQ